MSTGNREPGTGSDGYFWVSNRDLFTCQLIYNYMGSNMSLEDGEIMDVPSEDADLRAVEVSNVG